MLIGAVNYKVKLISQTHKTQCWTEWTVSAASCFMWYVNNLESLCIDNQGKIFKKDSYLYWDKKEQMIKGLVEEKYFIDILKLNNKSKINKIINDGNKFIVSLIIS